MLHLEIKEVFILCSKLNEVIVMLKNELARIYSNLKLRWHIYGILYIKLLVY